MRIEVNQLPPESCSPNSRVHWSKKYQDGKEYAEAVYYEAVLVRNTLSAGGDFRPFKRPVLHLTFVFRDHRRRDEDNLRARFKPGQDILVTAGLFQDDDMSHLIVKRPKVVVDPNRAPMTIIDLEEDKGVQNPILPD
ncbi:MAG: hypothetical protein PHU23_00230 [Dehalococcoidales bacterium]|nr:hypothetical protein [Dehalococcoidales bacterium]